MLKTTLLLGGGLVLAIALQNRTVQDVLAWLLALAVALLLLVFESLPLLAPLLPKIIPSGLLAAIMNLFAGGRP